MATVANGQVRQAHVSFSYFGPLRSPAYRVVDECFLPTSCLKEIGWDATIVDGKAEVTAEGSHFTLPIRNVAGKESIPLCRAIEELGGEATWSEKEPDQLSIVSIVRSIVLVDGRLKIDASMNVKALVSNQENPSRLLVTIPGAKLIKSGNYSLDSKSRLGQYKPDEIRIIWENDDLPENPSSVGPAKGLEVNFYSTRRNEPFITHEVKRVNPPVRASTVPAASSSEQRSHGEPSANPPSPSQGPSNPASDGGQATSDDGSGGLPVSPNDRVRLPIPLTNPRGNSVSKPGQSSIGPEAVPLKSSAPAVPVGPPQLTVESQDSLTLSMALSAPLQESPRVARPEPSTIEVTLPNADLKLSPDFKLDTESVSSVRTRKVGPNSVLTLHCSRPMGAEVVVNGTMVQVRLLKPRVGNGKLAGKTIVVDPGHGGRDTGCFSPDRTVFEKDLTLSMGKLVAQRLAEDGATVILTRKTDYLTPLEERPKIANRNNADFFISIHVNSLSIDNKVSGTRTYYHNNYKISQLLGECLQSEIVKVSGLPDKGVQSDTSLYTSGFSVLRGTERSIPAVLIEVGFINHTVDRTAMLQPEFQLTFALAIERGLKVYLGDEKKN